MIKMIVTDLDGTLLRNDKTVSDYTASVLTRCGEAGIKIVIATARPLRKFKELDLKFTADAVSYHNGAVITVGGVLFKQTGIDRREAEKFLRAASRFAGTKVSVEINDTLYANYNPSLIWPDIEFTLTDFSDLPDHPADKIIIEKTGAVELDVITPLLGAGLHCEIADNNIFMIMNKDARKLNAVTALAARFGIALSDIAAFGDDYNDIETLRACGTGVAVANAIVEAKSAADYICESNENDGVARWIEENLKS